MIALLASLAFAEPVPDRPVEIEVAGQCAEPYALRAGKPPPEGLVVDGIVTCNAVALPSGQAAHYKAVQVWADYQVVPALERTDIRLNWQRDVYEARLNAVTPGFLDKPAVQRTIGSVETLLVVAAVAGVFTVAQNQAAR